jgi:HEAT repeat protein
MRSSLFLSTFYVVGGVFAAIAQPQVTAWSLVTDAALNARSPDHRKEAVAAIGAIGPAPDAVKFLSGVLHNDPEPMVRQAAAASLGEMKAAEAVPALKLALEDSSGEVAFSAAKALWDLGDPAGTATFEEILTRERGNSENFMTGAIHDAKRMMRDPKRLAFMGAKEASGAILGPFSMGFTVAHDALKDSGATGRALAVEYMTKNCDARVVQLLKWSLQEDGNWVVKAASARGLGICADTDVIPMLEKYLNDAHEPLKYQAAAAIVRLGLKHPAQPMPAATAANTKP